jgi:hypothetical protein
MDIEIRIEPSGDAYQQLISVATEVCQSFSLVWLDADPAVSLDFIHRRVPLVVVYP